MHKGTHTENLHIVLATFKPWPQLFLKLAGVLLYLGLMAVWLQTTTGKVAACGFVFAAVLLPILLFVRGASLKTTPRPPQPIAQGEGAKQD